MSELTFIPNIQAQDFGLGGGFAIWGFRACAIGHGTCCAVRNGFTHAFGSDGQKMIMRMSALAEGICQDGKRQLQLAMPPCAQVTSDELYVAASLAAAQVLDPVARDAHLSWVLSATPSPQTCDLVDRIGEALIDANLIIHGLPTKVQAIRNYNPAFCVMEGGHA